MAMNLNREYTAILENATKVSYEKLENEIGSIEFTMPIDDPKNETIQALKWVELTDNENEYIGLYRIMPSETKKDKNNYTIHYTATHVLGTLLDSVLFGYHELVNRKTVDVINYVLSRQKVKHWVLKKCEFTRYFSYAWENENGLADALFSIPKAFDEEYIWEWNTQVYPFELSLVRPSIEPVCRVQEGYNMEGFSIKSDPNSLVNRVYPLGAGEGINQINIKAVNNGVSYVEDAASIKKYGLVEYVWVDQRFTIEQALKDNALAMLKKWSEPKISWSVTATDLIKLTDTPLEIDKLRQGSVVMVNTNEYGSVNLRIKREAKSDVFGQPQALELDIGNVTGDINTTMSDLGRKQQINETYSQGATNILNYSYQDNCEAAYPAEIEFYLDDDVFHVNTVELTFKTKKYRGYTKAVKGGGGRVTSTSAGGGSVVSSSSGGGYSSGSTTSGGGGSTQTSSVNGQSTQTSSANGSHRHRMFITNSSYGPYQTTKKWYKAEGTNFAEFVVATNAGDLYTEEAADNHSHTVSTPAHAHSISFPSHTHNFNVSIPNHTHNITIPNHTHQITLPDHTHPLEWGIYEASESATSVDIVVDGKTIPYHETSQQRLNIVDYLRKTSSGKISRGNHTIQIKPNKLARIEAQVICRVFIQSQLGGQF